MWRGAVLIAAILFPPGVRALEFRSVAEQAAILYDAPSTKAQKLFVLSAGYPVEVVVKLEGWNKVRDDTGEFAWIETARLSDRHTVMAKVNGAEVRQAPDESAPVVFTVDKNVFLELIETSAGWAKVRHADGASGFIKVGQLWGV